MYQASVQPLPGVEEHTIIPLLKTYQLMPQILRERILDRAIESIQYSAEEEMQAYQQFCMAHQIMTEDARQAWLHIHTMTLKQLKLVAIRWFKIEKFKRQMWVSKLRTYFLTRKRQLDWVIYSCIRVQDGYIARELFYRINEGEQTFAEIARDYSQGLEAHTGGIIGPVEMCRLPDPISGILQVSSPGQLLQPITFETCFVILRLEKLIPAQFDVAMQQRLLNELFENWLRQQQAQMQNHPKVASQLALVAQG